MKNHAMSSVTEGEHTHSLLGAAGKVFMSVTSSRFITGADAHLFFSGTHSVSAAAVLVLLNQGGDKDR